MQYPFPTVFSGWFINIWTNGSCAP